MERTTKARSARALALTLVSGLVAGVIALGIGDTTAEATTPGLQGPIYLAANGGNGIVRVNPDGTGQTLVVPGQWTQAVGPVSFKMYWPERPALSLDGSTLLFDAAVVQGDQAPNDAIRELFAMRLATGRIDRLRPGQLATGGRWRPGSTDGSIAYAGNTGLPGPLSHAATAVTAGRVTDSGGGVLTLSPPVPLTVINGERVSRIDWSPDGRALTYSRLWQPANVSPPQMFSELRVRGPVSGSFDKVLRGGLNGADLVTLEIQSSWAPDGRRVVEKLASAPPRILKLDPTTYALTGTQEIFGATGGDQEMVFAPVNDTGAPGDTFLTRRGNGLYILTSSATEGRIRGPITTGGHAAFWVSQTAPLVLGVPLVQLPPVNTVALPPGLQPRDLLNSTATQLCTGVKVLCAAPTLPTSPPAQETPR